MRPIFVLLLICWNTLSYAQDMDKLSLTYARLDSIGAAIYERGDYESGIPFMEYAVKKAKSEFGEKGPQYGKYANELGLFYDMSGKYLEGEQWYKTALAIRKESLGEQDTLYAETLNNLADLYTSMSQYKKAVPLFQEAMQIYRRVHGELNTEYASCLNNLARLYEGTGKYEKAKELYTKVAEIDRKTLGQQHPYYAASLNNIANVGQRMGQYEEALPLYLESKEIRQKVLGENHPDYAISLNNLATLYQRMGKYEEAEPLYVQAKEIRKKTLGEEHPYYASSLNNLAHLYEQMGRHDACILLYVRATEIRKKAFGAQHPTYAESLNNLAYSHLMLKHYKEAERFYLQAMGIEEKALGKQHPNYANTLNNLAVLYEKMNRKEEALALYLEAKDILKASFGTSHPSYVNSLDNLAAIHLGTYKLEKALYYCLLSLAANSENFNALFPAYFIRNSRSVKEDFETYDCAHYLKTSEFLKLAALDYYNTRRLNASLERLLTISNAFIRTYNSGTAESKDALLRHYNISKAVLQLNERIRNEFSGKQNKLHFMKGTTWFIQQGMEAVLKLGDAELMAEAFALAEQNKSVLLADALKGSRARDFGDLPDSLALEELALQAKKDALHRQKYEAKSENDKGAAAARENKVNLKIEQFLEGLKNKYPKYHALKYENITAKAKDIQALLDEKTVLLEFLLGEQQSYCFVLTKEAVQLIAIPVSKEKMEIKIRTLRRSLSDIKLITSQASKSYQLYRETAHWFYQKLLKEALATAPTASVENLIVVADGALGHLPFEAFLVEPAPDTTAFEANYKSLHYLVQDYNISYNYSATLLLDVLRRPEQLEPQKAVKMLAFAAEYTEPVDSSLLEIRDPNSYKLRKSLHALPEAEGEVKALSKVFDGTFLTGKGANERAFKEQAAGYGVIHLAMHGYLHPRLSMLSSLAFSEDRDSIEDNFLQAYEISRLNLNANLVVLSACETGYGRLLEGEGVVSLARSFMYAGTASLVVSLWQVNDNSTAMIMNHFYENLAKGLSKDAALRQAKLTFIDEVDGLVAHPAFWSAFIQLGDNRPIYLVKRGWQEIWMYIGIFAFIGLIIMITIRKKLF